MVFLTRRGWMERKVCILVLTTNEGWSLIVLLLCSSSWSICDSEGAHSIDKYFHVSLVQWGRSIHIQRSTQLPICSPTSKDPSSKYVSCMHQKRSREQYWAYPQGETSCKANQLTLWCFNTHQTHIKFFSDYHLHWYWRDDLDNLKIAIIISFVLVNDSDSSSSLVINSEFASSSIPLA